MTEPIVLLHLSDLHFGKNSRFAHEDHKEFGAGLGQAVQEEAERRGFKKKPDLVIVTGDVAQQALPSEYKNAIEFFGGLVGQTGVDRERFVFLPGNHDVAWNKCIQVQVALEGEDITEDQLEPTMEKEKFAPFEKFKKDFLDGDPTAPPTPLACGAFVYDFRDLRVSVAALNSCEEETHKKHGGELSSQQAQALMDHWSTTPVDAWIKIAAIHHNPGDPPQEVVEEYREFLKNVKKKKGLSTELINHFLADVAGFNGKKYLKELCKGRQVQLVLHGHQHEDAHESWPWSGIGNTHVLSAGSMGLAGNKLPKDQPNQVQLVVLDPDNERLRAHYLMYDPRKIPKDKVKSGHFVPDSAKDDENEQVLCLPEGWQTTSEAAKPPSPPPADSTPFVREYRKALDGLYARWDLRNVGTTGPARPFRSNWDRRRRARTHGP